MTKNVKANATLFVAAMAIGGTALGGPSVLTKSLDTASFTTASHWNPAVAPNSAEGSSTDYLVKNNYALRNTETGNAVIAFGGNSLSLGTEDFSEAGNFSQKGNKSWVQVNDLRLYRGCWESAANNAVGVRGNATVYSTEAYAFEFVTKSDYDGVFAWKLTGEENTWFSCGNKGQAKPLYMVNDATGFKGVWKIPANSYIRPQKGNVTIGPNEYGLQPTSSAMVFGKRDTFRADSVIFGDGVQLRYEVPGRTFAKSDNRGMKLEGTLTYMMVNGAEHHMYWPICGDASSQFKLSSNGKFHLHSSCGVRLSTTAGSSSIFLHSGASITSEGALVLTSGQVAAVSDVAEVSVCNPVFTDAGIVLAVSGDQAACMRLSGTVSVVGRISLGMTSLMSVSAVTNVPVLVIDRLVKREFTADDFDPWGVTGAQIANADSVVVSRNGDGDQVVSVRVFPYVRSNRSDGLIVDLENAGHWMPSGKPSSGHNYIVWNNRLRTGGTDWQNPYMVPGNQWVFYCTDANSASYESKHFDTQFTNARFLDGTGFSTASANEYRSMAISGAADIRTTKDGSVSFASGEIKMILSSTLTGRGNIIVKGVSRNPAVTTSNYSVTMNGDASGYAGYVTVTNHSIGTVPMVFNAASETNFGGNPEAFRADALRICNMVALTPTAAMVIDDENRGVTFADGASVDTAAGDVTVKTPVVFEGTFTKSGTGTFAFGAGGVTLGTGASITVAGGVLKAEGVDAFKGAVVSFADGAVLAVNAGMGALDLTTTTLSKAGAEYLIRLDGLTGEADIATFASAQAAADFVANARTVRGTGSRGRLKADGVTVKALVPGCAIIVR